MIKNSKFISEHMELRAKLLDYFFRNNMSNVNQLKAAIKSKQLQLNFYCLGWYLRLFVFNKA